MCFKRLKLNLTYVVRQGKLIGTLTYVKLCNYIATKAVRPAVSCLRALRAIVSIVCSCAFDVTKRMSPSGNTRDDDDDDDGDNNNNNNNDVPMTDIINGCMG